MLLRGRGGLSGRPPERSCANRKRVSYAYIFCSVLRYSSYFVPRGALLAGGGGFEVFLYIFLRF